MQAPRMARVSLLYRSALGTVYLAAFLSLAVQIVDLAGARGLLPFAAYLDQARAQIASWPARLHAVPTLLWIDPGDAALRGWPIAGAALAVVMIAGVGGRIVPLLLWVLYLSSVTSGRDFFHYQWDNLLLEAGFLAIVLPGRGSLIDLVRGRPLPEPAAPVVFLHRWLLFRLLFESGISKLIFGRDDWFRLNGMSFYYETSPLPSWGGWLMQQWPGWFHRLSSGYMFLVELPLALFVFLPRRFRLILFACHLPFQVSIALTSNYGFFNLLAIALSLMLLEDGDLRMVRARAAGMLRRWRRPGGPASTPARADVAAPPTVLSKAPPTVPSATRAAAPRCRRVAAWLSAAVLVTLSCLEGAAYFRRAPGLLRVGAPLRSLYAPLRSINVYHLFPGIVRERMVAEIEASSDGRDWRPYRLRYAPGDPRRPPPTTWLHNPRFPFHYSFLTLGRGGRDREYLVNLSRRLCCDPGALAGLFADDPWRSAGPAALRTRIWRYRFSTRNDLRRDGVYWLREPAGPPTPPFSCSCPPGG